MPYKPKNSRYWYASYRDARGKPIRRSTGTLDRERAEALEGQWKAEVWRQKHWGESPRYTFDALIKRVLVDMRGEAAHERNTYAAAALSPFFQGKVIADITAEDVAEFKRLRLQEVSVSTLIKELGFFSAAINRANAEWDWQVPNVVAGRIPSPPKGRIRWLTAEEAERLVAQASRRASAPYLADMIRLALNTGLRHRELLRLTWSRVDWQQQLLYFYPEDQKADRTDSVPINQAAMAVLRSRWSQRSAEYRTRAGRLIEADTAHVFTYLGRPIGSAKKSFARAAANAGIDDCTIHDLRHTFASRLVQAGVPIATVKEVMRHESIHTTMRYAHLAPENVRDAVATLETYDQTLPETGLSGAKSG